MSDKAHAPKAPKAIVEQLEVHGEGVGERDAADASRPSDRGATMPSSQEDSSRTGADGAQDDARASRRDFQRATVGFLEGLGRAAWAYANAHPHATLYGIIGFVLAVLILVIGLWDTIVIAVFVFVGTVIGQMVDGDNAAVNFIRRVLDGRK